MVTRISSTSGITSKGLTLADFNFKINTSVIQTILTPGVSDIEDVDDLSIDHQTTPTFYNEYQLTPQLMVGSEPIYTIESLNESIATVNANGRVTRVSDGEVGILVKTRLLTRRYDADVNTYDAADVDVILGWATGSLGEEMADAVDSKLSGKDKPVFSTQDHNTATYVRSTSCWAADYDLTGISPWNSRSSNCRAGVLVSPRHLLVAEHYPLYVNDEVRFVKADGTVVTRIITATNTIEPKVGALPDNTDVTVCLLDSDLPEDIAFYKVLPTDFENYIPGLSYGVPALILDQEEKALIAEFDTILASYNRIYFRYPSLIPTRVTFSETIIDGDSGNPSFLIIDGELILLTLFTWGGAGGGSNLISMVTAINAAMTSLGGGYQLTVKDLSGYPTY